VTVLHSLVMIRLVADPAQAAFRGIVGSEMTERTILLEALTIPQMRDMVQMAKVDGYVIDRTYGYTDTIYGD
jgi:hypothetical protein